MPRSRFVALYWYGPCLIELIRHHNFDRNYIYHILTELAVICEAHRPSSRPIIWHEKTYLRNSLNSTLDDLNAILLLDVVFDLPDREQILPAVRILIRYFRIDAAIRYLPGIAIHKYLNRYIPDELFFL
jgi:hypothetical protein